MGLGVGRHNLKTFGTTVYGLTHPTHTCIINVTNSNDSSYLLSDRRPTLKKDSNDYNNAGQGTFFQYRVENLPKKKSMFARATKTKLDIDDDYV